MLLDYFVLSKTDHRTSMLRQRLLSTDVLEIDPTCKCDLNDEIHI